MEREIQEKQIDRLTRIGFFSSQEEKGNNK